MLASARDKSKREVEALVVTLQPKPDAPVVMRKLPAASRATRVTALSPERYRIQITLSRETYDKFTRAQALLRHAVPSGAAAEIFDRALTQLLEELERRRFARTSRPRASSPDVLPSAKERSRHIPAAVRREVWQRDAGRCGFVGTEGRCNEIAFLEFHHVAPWAAGGEASVANIQLRCRAHNAYEARLFFGETIVRESRLAWGPANSRESWAGLPPFDMAAWSECVRTRSGTSS